MKEFRLPVRKLQQSLPHVFYLLRINRQKERTNREETLPTVTLVDSPHASDLKLKIAFREKPALVFPSSFLHQLVLIQLSPCDCPGVDIKALCTASMLL